MWVVVLWPAVWGSGAAARDFRVVAVALGLWGAVGGCGAWGWVAEPSDARTKQNCIKNKNPKHTGGARSCELQHR